ncbi:MAG: GDP-L-fucose synthase family protein [Opitutia bacterium]
MIGPDSRIYVAGHRGLVGSAVVRALAAAGHRDVFGLASDELDLRDPAAVAEFLRRERPDAVVMAAGRVGGVRANAADGYGVFRDNLLMAVAVVEGARAAGVRRLLYLGSSCAYPRDAVQPFREESLFCGADFEPTNAGYAAAKSAGVRLCDLARVRDGCDFFSVMPCNLYGPGDDFASEDSHVLPALIRRMHAAKERGDASVRLWGTGSPRREFLHVDDLARCCVTLLGLPRPPGLINVGAGEDVSIRDLAALVAGAVGFSGRIEFDPSMPDGVARKLMDVSRVRALGWKPRIGLDEGVRAAYAWYLANGAEARK